MPTDADQGGGDPENEWCSNCCHSDGTHKTLEECIAGFMSWVQSESCEQMGFPRATNAEEARSRAESTYLKSPAWK
jgi:hypothetical protein